VASGNQVPLLQYGWIFSYGSDETKKKLFIELTKVRNINDLHHRLNEAIYTVTVDRFARA